MIGDLVKSHFSLIGKHYRPGTAAEMPGSFMRQCNMFDRHRHAAVGFVGSALTGARQSHLSTKARRHIRNRSHHCIPDAGIVKRMAGAFDDPNFGLAP